MSTNLKEWLQNTIAELEEERDATPGAVNEDAAMALAAMKLALASLEAEAVAYMYKDNLHSDARFSLHTRFGNWSQEDINEYEITEIPLYAAPPAPVSIDERATFNAWNNDTDCPLAGRDAKTAAWLAWCRRSAMLQGAENAESPPGIKPAPALDSVAKNAESPPGNSPVITDGWVACSERMPEWNDDVLCATEFDGPGDWRKKVGYWHDGKWVIYGGSWTPTHWMPLPAAPQQEDSF